MAYFEGEIPVVSTGYGNNGGMWGADGGWWAIILFAMIFGWGRNGWGGNGGGGDFGYDIGKLATTNDVASGFSTSAIMSNQRENQLSLQSGFADVQQTLCQGFNGVNTSILTTANGIQQSLADCCCKTQRAIDGVNYNMAKNTCDITNTIHSTARDIIDSQRESTNSILGFLTNEKISGLQAQNAALTAQLSQNSQTATLLNAINRTPTPAYVVPNPYCCNNYSSCGSVL